MYQWKYNYRTLFIIHIRCLHSGSDCTFLKNNLLAIASLICVSWNFWPFGLDKVAFLLQEDIEYDKTESLWVKHERKSSFSLQREFKWLTAGSVEMEFKRQKGRVTKELCLESITGLLRRSREQHTHSFVIEYSQTKIPAIVLFFITWEKSVDLNTKYRVHPPTWQKGMHKLYFTWEAWQEAGAGCLHEYQLQWLVHHLPKTCHRTVFT